MINPFQQWFNVSNAGLRALSQIGITTHWLILQYSIGLFTVTVGFEILARWLKKQVYLDIAKSLSKVSIVIFAAGAATGSAGEFGLLLFWPGFLELAGKYFFIPFYMELFAFFAEVIFVYMYYYTWDRAGPRFHLFMGLMGVFGLYASALLIMTANTLMGFPPGIQATYDPTTGLISEPTFALTMPDGTQAVLTSSDIHQVIATDPDRFQAILGATLKQEGIFGMVFSGPGVMTSFLHATISAILVTIFTIIGVYSYRYIHQPETSKEYYREGIRILSFFAIVNFVLQGIIGHFVAHDVARYNPEKLAAIEGTSANFTGISDLPLLGPWVDPFITFLAFGSFDDYLPNYDNINGDYQAPIIIHYIYYAKMFLIVGLVLNISIFSLFYIRRRTNPPDWFIKVNYSSPVFINLITLFGWMVREIGRKPWTIYGMIPVEDAARTEPVPPILIAGVFIYCFVLLGGVIFIVYYLFRIPSEKEFSDRVETPAVEPQEKADNLVVVEGGSDDGI